MNDTLHLLADDLTGALDSAARFVPAGGPLPVLRPSHQMGQTAAIDSATRDLDTPAAAAIVAHLSLELRGTDIAFKKADGLLRGNVVREFVACMRHFDHTLLVSTFPFQGRVSRSGWQWMCEAEVWPDTGVDLPTQLRGQRHGRAAVRCGN